MYETWEAFHRDESEKPEIKELYKKVNRAYAESIIHPNKESIFAAMKLTPIDSVKCVILGQDPYHEPGQAMGLSFSVYEGVPLPPSLLNIFKEIRNEYGVDIPKSGDLTRWATQGVLLLNSILTVQDHLAASHQNFGWQIYTDDVIRACNEINRPVVYMLWGNYARSKKAFITNKKHLVLESAHPSPLSASRGFMGNGHFKKCNEFLKRNGLSEIEW